MNQTGIVEDDYNNTLFENTKSNNSIDSTFTPMIKLV